MHQLREVGEEVLLDIISSYLQDSPQQLLTIASTIERGDAPSLQRSTHTLKSSSAAVGANQLAQICSLMESMSRAGQIEAVAPLLEEAWGEYARVEVALKELL